MITLSIPLRDARLQALAEIVDGAGEGAVLELYEGTMPNSPGDGPGASVQLIVLSIPLPFADDITNGVLTGATLPEAMATETGEAQWARIRDAAGVAQLDLSAGATGSGHPVTLPDTQLYAGMLVEGVSVTFTEG